MSWAFSQLVARVTADRITEVTAKAIAPNPVVVFFNPDTRETPIVVFREGLSPVAHELAAGEALRIIDRIEARAMEGAS